MIDVEYSLLNSIRDSPVAFELILALICCLIMRHSSLRDNFFITPRQWNTLRWNGGYYRISQDDFFQGRAGGETQIPRCGVRCPDIGNRKFPDSDGVGSDSGKCLHSSGNPFQKVSADPADIPTFLQKLLNRFARILNLIFFHSCHVRE